MSGPFGAGGLQLFGGAGDFYPYSIDQSLRFEDGDSPYLQRTSANGDTRTWTVSFWTKLCSHDTYQYFLCSSVTSDEIVFRFNNDGTINFQIRGGLDASLTSTRTFRDLSAWLHMVVRVDTTQSTSTDRVRIYANNELISLSGTYPDQNDVTTWNKNSTNQIIGRRSNGTFYVNSYMAEFHNIDGQSLGPDSFGETKAGIWIPKEYTGSHGTAGFYLDFADSSAIGNDVSGNNNDLTVSGPDASDVVLDSPTNNFATFNALSGPNFYGTAGPYSHGNLHMRADNTVSSYLGADSTIGVSSGKWYWEIRSGSNGSSFYPGIGIRSPDGGDSIIHYRTQTQAYINGSPSGQTLSTYTIGDIIGVALDLDSGTNTLQFYKNGSANGTTFSLTSGQEWLSITGNRYHSSTSANFGADSSFFGNETAQGNADDNGIGDFYYSPPSGFLALCSANLPNPGIDPAKDDEPADYFNTVLYTGTGSAPLAITGVGFQPDWVWVKRRNAASNHHLFDSVRGTDKFLQSSTSDAEQTGSNNIDSFDSDGFTLNATSATNPAENNSGDTYVSWNWLAGGTASSNTDGDITSSVSANTEAGFSIVSYTGDGSTSTVGHGLSNAPELSIFKNRDDTDDWAVSTTVIDGSHDLLYLNLTSAKANITVTAPTSSVFTVNNSPVWNQSGEDYIAYCFHSVDGYCDIGSYTGNGSSDGRFIYTGFRPAWLLTKATSTTSSWGMFDSVRDAENVTTQLLLANSSNAESTASGGYDLLSNGFKIRDNGLNNTSGQTYIYLAFAEQPFKYSNAR